GDGQELDGGEEERIAEPVDLRPLAMALEAPHQERAGDVDDDRERQSEREPRDQPAMALLPARKPPDLLTKHAASVAAGADGSGWMDALGVFARLYRLVWGEEVDRALRPVLAISFVESMSFSAGWTFVGVWAIEHLGASSKQLGIGFLVAAVAGSVAGYLGGHASDHVGRRPLILLGWGLQSTTLLGLAFAGHHVVLGLGLVALGSALGSIGQGADQAMIADLVPPERHEASYAAVRVASNLGVTCGPPIGGLLLIGRHWPVLWAGVALLAFAGWLIGFRYLPRRGAYTPAEPPTRGSFGVIRRDGAFLLFLLSGGLAYLTYVAFETVLPISAVSTHGI